MWEQCEQLGAEANNSTKVELPFCPRKSYWTLSRATQGKHVNTVPCIASTVAICTTHGPLSGGSPVCIMFF